MVSSLDLTGAYEHSVDDKGRLFVSSKLRSQIDSEEHGSSFYISPGPHGIYCLYPEKYFQQIVLVGASGMDAPNEAVAFERIGFGLASKVELDRQGRLLLPEKFRKKAKLGNNLTLVGTRDHIELWNTDDWEKYLSTNIAKFQQHMMQARQTVLQNQIRELELQGEDK